MFLVLLQTKFLYQLFDRSFLQTQPHKNKFAVEDVAASKDTIAAWWAVGGIGISALGYAGWEWRREIGEILYKIKNIISGGK